MNNYMNKHISSRKTSFLAAAMIGAALILSGCATPTTHEAMVPVGIQVAKQHPKSVSVTADGGSDTDSMGKSQISNDALKQAVVAAINQSKAFSSVVEGKNGDYTLAVNLISLTQPSFGFSFTVGMEMGWTLTRVDSGVVVWRESIKSEHTASATDAFAGTTRLRMATEGAARNNVAAGLTKISALSL